MSIKPLNKETVQLINCTQTISSISSAIKELVENSLDAQAQNIEINLVNNGLSLIEVKDNGLGISILDAQYMALASHTSKISSFNDLDSLSTYGFRGEGLNSICKVSDVTICTKTNNDETMACFTLNNEGLIVNSEISHGLTGTTVKMKNLFKNMPVRRNILNNKKSINQEIKIIEILLKSYAICKYSVRFMLRINSNTIFSKSSCKNVSEALKFVVGIQIFSKLTLIEKEFDRIKMQLFIPKKGIEICTEISQVGFQLICINDRPIKSKKIEKLINKRISDYFNKCNLNNQKLVFYMLLKIDSSMLDVNLEPNKDKVFLQNETTVLSKIDEILLNYYELADPNELPQNNVKSNKNVDENFKKIKKEITNNEKLPVCKKRKMDENDDINISDNFFKNINDLVLSDSDSNDMDELKEIKKNKNYKYLKLDIQEEQNENNSEDFDFAQDILTKEEIIDESLSQLPKVDLGEDFDLNDLHNKSSSNTETINLQEISDEAWSKGQISGLKNGIKITSDKILVNKENDKESQECSSENSELFNFNENINQINDSQELDSKDVPDVKIEEFNWELTNEKTKMILPKKSNKLNKTLLNASLDPTQTKIPFAGYNNDSSSIPSAFSIYCTDLRAKFVKEHPELTPTEVAIYMNQKWKQISPEERQHYRDLANEQIQNLSNLSMSQIFKKVKSEPTPFEKDKNKKHFISMLGNMKKNKTEEKNESIIMRTFKPWNINISMVAEKFKKPVRKKKKFIVGPLNSLVWILNLTPKLFAFDITELQVQLNMKPCDPDRLNRKYVEHLVDHWFINKNDMSVFHLVHSYET